MRSNSDELTFDFAPFIRLYKNGRIERLIGTEIVPPTTYNPQTGVSSKDIIIIPGTGVSARLFLPKIIDSSTQKLPLLFYIHGGAFCIDSPFSPTYDRYVSSLVAEANVVAVSVHYRRAPEYPVPIAFDDSWAALQWIASHSKGKGPELWLNEYADLSKISMVGDSAGATIAHNMAIRAAETPLEGLGFVGLGLIHPFFYHEEPVGPEVSDEEKKTKASKLWMVMCPSSIGCNDPLINPAACDNLKGLVCKRVVICIAEKDRLIGGGVFYYETLRKSGWKGEVELMEAQGEDHVFHLFNPTNQKALAMKTRLASLLNN
ncbi:probable carboxylesterase 2 [Telopea speciosissima]|uniref:probable carboxylesterase 2 n=1 Tax=Telopea speciosissima TaxID=54955 RepID=UPI001CC4849D|nr:probable carboxylesterase 2 [Telopea speciosissima]